MRHATLWFLLSLTAAAAFAGCNDPNPTFFFDASPSVRVTATDAGTSAADGGTDASGDAR